MIKKIIIGFFSFPIIITLILIIAFPLSFASGTGGGVVGGNIYDFDINLPSYKKSNIFWPKFNGQCTWYVWGRSHQLFGVTNLPTRDAKYWLEIASQRGYRTGDTPSKNSIIVLGGTVYGHVAYVEGWDGTNITVSEANVNWQGYMPPNGVGLDAPDSLVLEHIRIQTYDYQTYRTRYLLSGLKIMGYIYLE